MYIISKQTNDRLCRWASWVSKFARLVLIFSFISRSGTSSGGSITAQEQHLQSMEVHKPHSSQDLQPITVSTLAKHGASESQPIPNSAPPNLSTGEEFIEMKKLSPGDDDLARQAGRSSPAESDGGTTGSPKGVITLLITKKYKYKNVR